MPVPSFPEWVQQRIESGALDERLGQPLTDEEKAWVAETGPEILEAAGLEMRVETMGNPGVEVLGKVIEALVKVPHQTQLNNASKLVRHDEA